MQLFCVCFRNAPVKDLRTVKVLIQHALNWMRDFPSVRGLLCKDKWNCLKHCIFFIQFTRYMKPINGLYNVKFGQEPFLVILLAFLLINSGYGKRLLGFEEKYLWARLELLLSMRIPLRQLLHCCAVGLQQC